MSRWALSMGKVDEVQDLTVDIAQMSPVFKLLKLEIVQVVGTLQDHCIKSSVGLIGMSVT